MASSPSLDADQLRDLNALMTWLRTFPRVEETYDECQDISSVLNDKEVATGLLFCADEICDVKLGCESCKKDTETIYNTISTIVVSKMPQVQSQLENTSAGREEVCTFLLSALLCFAVSESCPHRRMYIERILGLPHHCQQALMRIIEKGQSAASSPPAAAPRRETPRTSGSKRSLEETCSDDDEEQPATSERPLKQSSTGDGSLSNKSWAVDDSFASPSAIPGYTPQKRKSSRLSVESLFSPNTIDSTLENLVADLRKEKESLQQELVSSQQREQELGQKLQDNEIAFRKEMMKLESASLQREEDVREAHAQETAALRHQVEELKIALETEQRAHKELESVRDEMDLLQHTKEKLAETEEKLLICRERLEQLGDIKEALTREEEAHGVSVEECLRLQNELKALQPLRRQLEDYKTRAVEAEVKLSECQADLKRLEQVTGNLSSAQKELMEGAKLHKEEAEELRRRLLEEESTGPEGPSVGEGLSELNPKVMEEMARLRNENIQLKAFAEAREDDAVQMLSERLEDSQRLSERYKDQFLSTKVELEQTEQKLQESHKQVADLKDQVQDLTGSWEQLGQDLNDCNNQLSDTQANLSTILQLLQESKEREETLRGEVERLKQDLAHEHALCLERFDQLEYTTLQLADTTKTLEMVQEQEQRLKEQVVEWTEKTTVAETALSNCEKQLAEAKGALDVANTALNAALEREAGLKDTVTDLEKMNQDLQAKIEGDARSTEAALLAAETELLETKCELQDKAIAELEQVKQSMNELLENERTTLEQKLAVASEKYSRLEEKAASDLTQLEEKCKSNLEQAMDESRHTQEQLKQQYEEQIATIEKLAEEEREQLIKKGKGMLKDSKAKAKQELTNVQDQLEAVEAELTDLRERFEAYETKTKKQLREYKKKLAMAGTRIDDLAQSNDSMEDSIRDLERERFKLQEENERFRRQLGGRYGADGKVQNQLETLRNEFDAILEENRGLRKEIEKMGNPLSAGLASISEMSESEGGHTSYTRGGVSGSTFAELRKEYEAEIAILKDVQREHVMKCAAAITEVQKAENRAWESDKQVQKLKEEVTSLKLKLQRLQQTSEGSGEYHDAICAEPFDQDSTKENILSQEAPTSYDFTPQGLSQSSNTKNDPLEQQANSEEMLLDLSCSEDKAIPLSESTNDRDVQEKAHVNAYDFPPISQLKKKFSSTNKSELLQPVPSLIDHVNSSSEDVQPECKQS